MRVQLFLGLERLASGVGDHVRVREAILLVHAVEDFDLELEERSVCHAGDERLFLRDAGGLETLVARAAQLVSAEEVTELVLVAEILVPVGTEEEVVCFLARPPRLLEVVPELDVATLLLFLERERRLPLRQRTLTDSLRAGGRHGQAQ